MSVIAALECASKLHCPDLQDVATLHTCHAKHCSSPEAWRLLPIPPQALSLQFGDSDPVISHFQCFGNVLEFARHTVVSQ